MTVKPYIGRWRLVEMSAWEADDLDEVAPVFAGACRWRSP